MAQYKGTIVEESLEDNRILNDFRIVGVKITDNDNPLERWHLYLVELTEEDIQKLANSLKPKGWYAHFWNQDTVIAVFRGKTFSFSCTNKETWGPAIEYGLSVGIPLEQLDFLINTE